MPKAPRSIQPPRRTRQPDRRTTTERGYDAKWRRFRKAWLNRQFIQGNVTCGWCGKLLTCAGRDIHVDHIRPHRGDLDLMYDETNLQALHAACHSQKTAIEDGGFGNRSSHAK